MIRPDARFEHVDIDHARRFVDISKIAQPNPRVLYVLHEKGRVLKAWDSQKGRVVLKEKLQPSQSLAEKLRQEHGVDEVQLIEREGLNTYYREALDLKKAQELSGYDFKERTRELKGAQGNGFIIHPPRESYDYYHYIGRTKAFVAQRLQPDCAFILGVHAGENWWTSVATDFTGGQIVQLSTFEIFPTELLAQASSPQAHQALVDAAAKHFKKPAFGMFLAQEAFEGFARQQWRGMGQTPLLRSEP